MILDEATSHLDSESELAIQRALDAALEDRTAIVIAHRLSTIVDADRILVVDDGRIVEQGTPRRAARAGGLYSDLYRTQSDGADGGSPGAGSPDAAIAHPPTGTEAASGVS